MSDEEETKPTDKRLNNKFWLARSTHGRDKIFKSPDILWEAAMEYFEWCDENPLYADATSNYQGYVTHEPIAKMRAMTLDGLYTFLEIGQSTWSDYRNKEDYKEYSVVIERIESIIKNQKFQGAAAGMLNPVIISRDIGLVEKKETELTGPNGGPIDMDHTFSVEFVNAPSQD